MLSDAEIFEDQIATLLDVAEGFLRTSRAKTLNGIREMRIYFGSIERIPGMQRNVRPDSAENGIVQADCWTIGVIRVDGRIVE